MKAENDGGPQGRAGMRRKPPLFADSGEEEGYETKVFDGAGGDGELEDGDEDVVWEVARTGLAWLCPIHRL